jgi:phosphoribosyl-dephospho-CoA transferase
VFGSLAWQTLTGERYLSDGSDLDVVFPLPAAALRDALLDGLAALDARARCASTANCCATTAPA